jgi:hypothetical protein
MHYCGRAMPKKRGGARPGAGRPPELTDLQRLQIGAAVEQLLWQETRAAWARADDAEISNLTDGELPRLWEEIWGAPIADRHRVKIGRILHDAAAEIKESLQGKQYIKGPTRVAAGIRGPTIRSVARDASQHWGQEVTPRMVKRCLEEFRAINARANIQLTCDGIAALLNWLGVTREV